MLKIRMSDEEILDQIDFEDSCGVNTLLQEIVACKSKPKVYKIIDERGITIDYKVVEENKLLGLILRIACWTIGVVIVYAGLSYLLAMAIITMLRSII